eukprot:XP_028352226.1 uncharacterized protein LOC114487248 isoform X4 [Physeter catodon]
MPDGSCIPSLQSEDHVLQQKRESEHGATQAGGRQRASEGMCSAAVHPELPPRGGAASAVEEKQRVCRELPDQGIRPESAIPREPPAKPRWAGVLSPTEPCSPKLSVPCVRGNPSTASSSSLSRSSLASSALAEQFWNGPWIALEKQWCAVVDSPEPELKATFSM